MRPMSVAFERFKRSGQALEYIFGVAIGIILFIVGMSGPTVTVRNPAGITHLGSVVGWGVGILALVLAGYGMSSENKFMRGLGNGVIGSMFFCAFATIFMMFIGFPLFVAFRYLRSAFN